MHFTIELYTLRPPTLPSHVYQSFRLYPQRFININLLQTSNLHIYENYYKYIQVTFAIMYNYIQYTYWHIP